MCGILGYIDTQNDIDKNIFEAQLSTLVHRGPDDYGLFYSENGAVALGHRRLSFLDLTQAGKQPFSNTDQSIWITFNGEIYNYLELKEQLKSSYQFITQTDTEVIIAAYQTWGIDFINKLKGMFAIGLYDSVQGKLYLIRDRFGIKPLYYTKQNGKFFFASELKAIIKSGIVEKKIDFSSFADYFVYRYIPSPKTIWENIYKLPAAHYLQLDVSTLEFTTQQYWEIISTNTKPEEQELVDEVNNILEHSVAEHTRSDVPVGSFLSGGYDSSALVHYMKKLGQQPQTFSIGFTDWEKSEDYFAAVVATHLDVKNESIIVNESSLDLLDIMADVYDEPIADISILPTYLVSKLAKTKVKAVLSGEGADELFAGYTWQHDYMNKQNSTNWFNKLFSTKKSANDTVLFYAKAMSMGWFDADELKQLLNENLHQFIPDDVHWFYRKHLNENLSPLKSIQYLDIKCFMGELVLTKIDRASMANSLEVRVPFLDHTLVEKIFSVQEKSYFHPTQTKYLLYKNIKNYLPQQILQRKKQGFVGPDSYYMNLAFYKKELANSALVKHNIINQTYIDKLLEETYNWKLWKIIVMEKWFRKWIE